MEMEPESDFSCPRCPDSDGINNWVDLIDHYLTIHSNDVMFLDLSDKCCKSFANAREMLLVLLRGEQAAVDVAFKIAAELHDIGDQWGVKELIVSLGHFENEKDENLKECSRILTKGQHDFNIEGHDCEEGITAPQSITVNGESRDDLCLASLILSHAIGGNKMVLSKDLLSVSKRTKYLFAAGLGLVNRGRYEYARNVMETLHLETDKAVVGGALHAIGIIYATKCNDQVVDFLKHYARDGPIGYGASIALGLVGISSRSEEIWQTLESGLYININKDNGAHDCAGTAMGLVFLGCGKERAFRLLDYATDIGNDGIIRGLSMGAALCLYGEAEAAEEVIQRMMVHQNPIMQCGGLYAIGMAYRGSSNQEAVDRLLDQVRAENDKYVRRTALICVAFVMYRSPGQAFRILSPFLAVKDNYIRWGACIAIGLCCREQKAYEALENALNDDDVCVQQGAIMSMAIMVMSGLPQNMETFAERLKKFVSVDRNPLRVFGVSFANGCLDAKKKGKSISLFTKFKRSDKIGAVTGLALFTQFLFSIPMAFSIGLAFDQ